MNLEIRKLLAEIDLTKSANSNFPYMTRDLMSDRTGLDIETNLPLSPEKSEWEASSDLLSRVYQINNRKHFSYFLNNILDHANKLGHDPTMIINYPNISIKLKTHDLDEVTEIDLEFAKFIDEIYEDINFLIEEF